MSDRGGGFRRGAVGASATVMAVLWWTAVSAAPMQFGYSGLQAIPQDVYDSMDEATKRSFVEARLARSEALGGTILRTGSASPRFFEREDVLGGSTPDWRGVDHAVGVLVSLDPNACITLPELVEPAAAAAFNSFLGQLVERYDGDTDFDVDVAAPDQLWAYPDINGSGEVNSSDWGASDSDKQAWATAHRVSMLEIGVRPRASEVTGTLDDGDYAAQLQTAIQVIRGVSDDVDVMLGGTQLHDQSKHHFVDRLESLSADARAEIATANAHVYGEVAGGDVGPVEVNLGKFQEWLEAADLDQAERWVGALALPSEGNAASGGPCAESQCTERTQASGLVRSVMQAARDGYAAVLYDRPIEVVGAGVEPSAWTGSGLLVLERVEGIELGLLPLRPRPAYAVWRWLASLLGGDEEHEISSLHSLPQNTVGVKVAKGWVLWYDWRAELGADADYDGAERPVMLENLEAPSVRVRSLWPESVATQLADDGDAGATWTEHLVEVVDGSAQVMVGQDPVWVELSEESVQVDEPDAGAADDVEPAPAQPDVGPTPDESGGASSGGGDDGGCSSGAPRPWFGLAALWLAVCLIQSRKRRTGREEGLV